jgi:hypothetical protein
MHFDWPWPVSRWVARSLSQGVIIEFADGVYTLPAPLVFSAAASPLQGFSWAPQRPMRAPLGPRSTGRPWLALTSVMSSKP